MRSEAGTCRGGVNRRLRHAVVVVIAGLLVLAGCTAPADPAGPVPTAQAATVAGYTSADGSVRAWAPDERSGPVELAGTDYTGERQDVTGWRGDVVVLNTWYAACPPCRAEAPDLVALAHDYADRGLRMLGINGVDGVGAAESFERTFDVPYPSIDDADGRALAALQGMVPVQATPTTVVLDRAGRVAVRIIGLVDPGVLRPLVDELLDEPA